jgi:hypothetical protein
MRDRTEPAWEGDLLLARTAALLEETRRLLAEVEEQVRQGWKLRRQSQELRAARVTVLRRPPGKSRCQPPG